MFTEYEKLAFMELMYK